MWYIPHTYKFRGIYVIFVVFTSLINGHPGKFYVISRTFLVSVGEQDTCEQLHLIFARDGGKF